MLERYSRPAMRTIWSDEAKFEAWLAVELAVCEARHEIGEISEIEIAEIRTAKVDAVQIREIEADTGHEMTAFLQNATTGNGPAGRWLHYGLTSSDVMDTGMSLLIRRAAVILDDELERLIEVLRRRAIEFKETPMIGRTHGMYAEPITFGLKLATWWDEIRRHRRRLREAAEELAVGMVSGPVGTHSAIPLEVEERACKILDLPVATLSSQALSRDRHANFAASLGLIGASLEKIATEIRLLHQSAVSEVEEPRPPSRTDSSSMPHKANPLMSERICGLARLVRANVTTALETVSLWGERDLTNSSVERITIPENLILVDFMIATTADLIGDLTVKSDVMLENLRSAEASYVTHHLVLNLVDQGEERTQAYSIARDVAAEAHSETGDVREVLRSHPALENRIGSEEADSLLSHDTYLKRVDSLFERAGLSEHQ